MDLITAVAASLLMAFRTSANVLARASGPLEIICEDYADKQITVTLDSMVEIVAAYMSSLDADQGVKFRDAVNARVTPIAAP